MPALHALSDIVAWSGALTVAKVLRYGALPTSLQLSKLVTVVAVAAVTQTVVGVAIGVYRRRWRYGSFEEVLAVAGAYLITSGVLLGATVLAIDNFSRTVPIIGGFIAVLVALAGRSLWRLWR
ncbi:MAG: hypothetical protein ACO307_17065, partial [Ilumatobacteraceae bacterium]